MTINNQQFILKQGQNFKSFISDVGGRLTIINCYISELHFMDNAKWADVLKNYYLEITYIYKDSVNELTINPLVSFFKEQAHSMPIFDISTDIFMGPQDYMGGKRTLSEIEFKMINIQNKPLEYEFRISYNKGDTVKEKK